jgi:signal transduction histidine kinase
MTAEHPSLATHAAAYAALLKRYCATPDEALLAELGALGRRLVQDEVPPEEIADFQEQALAAFAPDSVATVLPLITAPLAEVLMAYGLTFRAHLEQRYAALLQERLRQGERLEALGTLAAGIAHDFNTLLGVILGFTEMTLDTHPPGSQGRANLEQVLVAVQRARDLVAKILTFARQEQSRREIVALDEVLEECLALLRPTLPPGVAIETRIALTKARILDYPGDLRQIIINLAINAADAMAGFGTLTLSVAVAVPPLPPDLQAGEYLALTVRDTGGGIPPQLLPRIFDPFFTTKAPGHGSGLGLSVVHGIVTRLGGTIRVASTLGQGTAFEVFLPRWRAPAHPDPFPLHGEENAR